MKRLVDVFVSGVALVVLSPLLACLAIAIKYDSAGPVLFRQVRVGKSGVEFELLKFRSMVADAPSLGGHATSFGDVRITRVGSLLRKSSLDEIPQLVNVLRGEMSIVGPRPSVPQQVEEYQPADWVRRVAVRPGITGLAQVHGRSEATFDERLRHDLAYVESHGLLTDLRIALLTVRQLIEGGGN